MKKSVIGPDFEKKDAVPPYSESKEALKQKRRVSYRCSVCCVSLLQLIVFEISYTAHHAHINVS